MNRRQILKAGAGAAVAATVPLGAALQQPVQSEAYAIELEIAYERGMWRILDEDCTPLGRYHEATSYTMRNGYCHAPVTFLDGLNAMSDAYTFVGADGRIEDNDAIWCLIDHGRTAAWME